MQTALKKLPEQVRYYIATHARYPLPNINENFFRHFILACNAILIVKHMSSYLVHIIILHIHMYYKNSHVSKCHVSKDHFINVSRIACVPVLCTDSLYCLVNIYHSCTSHSN